MAFPRLNALDLLGLPCERDVPLCRLCRSATARMPAGSTMCPTPPAYDPGLNIDFYALGMVFLGISTTVGAANFIVTLAAHPRARDVDQSLPILVWGTLTASVANLFVVPAVSLAFFLLWMDRQFGTHFFDTAAAASRCCGSICSGCSAIRGSMRSFCRPWAWSRTRLPIFCRRPLVGYSAVALSDGRDHDPRVRGVGAPHVRDRLAGAVAVVLQRGLAGHHHPERRGGIRLDRHHLDRTAGVHDRRSSSSPASSSCSSSAASPGS